VNLFVEPAGGTRQQRQSARPRIIPKFDRPSDPLALALLRPPAPGLFKFVSAAPDGALVGPCVSERWPLPGAAAPWVLAHGHGPGGVLRHGTGPGVHVLNSIGVLHFVRYWSIAAQSVLWEVEVDPGLEGPPGMQMVWNSERFMAVVPAARLLRPAPWDDNACRALSAVLAAAVLPVWTELWPEDPRPAQAIAAARQVASGEREEGMLRAAGEAALLATCGPWGSCRGQPRSPSPPAHERQAAAWAAIAAARTCALWTPPYTSTALLKTVLGPVLDAGLRWETATRLCAGALHQPPARSP
jgi:hypothetical protein